MDVVAAVEQLTFYAVDEAGLGGVTLDILESVDASWRHGSTFLQGTQPSSLKQLPRIWVLAGFSGGEMIGIWARDYINRYPRFVPDFSIALWGCQAETSLAEPRRGP